MADGQNLQYADILSTLSVNTAQISADTQHIVSQNITITGWLQQIYNAVKSGGSGIGSQSAARDTFTESRRDFRDTYAARVNAAKSSSAKLGSFADEFEESLKKLEEASEKLRSQETSLEDAISNYEEGLKAYKECARILEEAQQKVEVLTK